MDEKTKIAESGQDITGSINHQKILSFLKTNCGYLSENGPKKNVLQAREALAKIIEYVPLNIEEPLEILEGAFENLAVLTIVPNNPANRDHILCLTSSSERGVGASFIPGIPVGETEDEADLLPMNEQRRDYTQQARVNYYYVLNGQDGQILYKRGYHAAAPADFGAVGAGEYEGVYRRIPASEETEENRLLQWLASRI